MPEPVAAVISVNAAGLPPLHKSVWLVPILPAVKLLTVTVITFEVAEQAILFKVLVTILL